MKNKVFNLGNVVKRLQRHSVYDVASYEDMIREINNVKLDGLGSQQLEELSLKLRTKAMQGASLDSLLIEAFALASEASVRVLGYKPYNVQLMAAIAIHRGNIVEMQTGEGKTLAAVMPGYLNALTGKGVHILTFNDYLAARDANWMGPVYELLGLSVGFIREGMDVKDRKKAYDCDITYLTAKEAGFDYLRDFLCTDIRQLAHRPFNYAIIDEADSILIDEARVPLVIAAQSSAGAADLQKYIAVVRSLQLCLDYEVDQYGRNISLTEKGILKAERLLGCSNLYSAESSGALAMLNCALQAEVLLLRDNDYIVRNGRIEIIDEFTGRIADKRHWPDGLHRAVEAKEGLGSQSEGVIMGSIAMQHFINLYPKIAGMTGTAQTEAQEFRDFYCMDVIVIPTNKPCVRKDHEELIFADKEAKQNALVAEIKRVHLTGQPVLIGTGSVEESELLAQELRRAGVGCNVLNAKNDELEAAIISRAGELGAVTVSTNMAGRGIDIKLGGGQALHRDRVAVLGGLYVIGTNRNESRRIDNQLRGRAGRQGDPGESRFFISLQDDIVVKFNMLSLLPKGKQNGELNGLLKDEDILRGLARGQRIVEGYNSDIRRQLWKYAYIIEQQRRIIHKKREDILNDKASLQFFDDLAGRRVQGLYEQYGEGVVKEAKKQIALYHINKAWSEYLDYISYIREGIHLVVIGNQDPLHEFHKQVIHSFREMEERIIAEAVDKFNKIQITKHGIDLEKEGLKGPSSTWTYIINDSPDQFSNLSNVIKTVSNYINGPLFTLRMFFNACTKKKGKNKYELVMHNGRLFLIWYM